MRFRLHWLLLTICTCAAFVAAGCWQYGRGVEKAALLQAFEAALSAPARPIAQALQQPAELPRTVQGMVTRLPLAPWLLLDNVRRGADVGVRAVALYQVEGGAPLLVDFGWLPLPPDRQLPVLDPPPDALDARGLLVAMPGQGLRLAANPWPAPPVAQVLLTYLDLDEVAAALGQRPVAALLRLSPELPTGFQRDLDALPNTLPPERHYGYALQWFGFATAVALIYLILLFRTSRT